MRTINQMAACISTSRMRMRTHLAKDAVLQAGGEDVDAVLLGVLREPGLAGLVRSGLNGAEES